MVHIGRRLKKWLIIFGAVLFVMLVMVLTYTSIGTIGAVGSNGQPLSVSALSSIQPAVIDSAAITARQLCEGAGDKYDALYNQLLGLYLEAKDKELIVIFNSGGWGWNVAEAAEGWNSILDGIKAELGEMGYSTLLVNYQRTEKSLRAYIDEAVELFRTYPKKAEYLAQRIDFLIRNIPNIKVILAGESNSTVISDTVMNKTADSNRVYSIQTGPPFWHKPAVHERALILDNNGVTPDTFTAGDIPAMLWASLKALFGVSPDEREKGHVLNYLSAPGHDYSWDYPYVSTQISSFLEKNFGGNGRKPSE